MMNEDSSFLLENNEVESFKKEGNFFENDFSKNLYNRVKKFRT